MDTEVVVSGLCDVEGGFGMLDAYDVLARHARTCPILVYWAGFPSFFDHCETTLFGAFRQSS